MGKIPEFDYSTARGVYENPESTEAELRQTLLETLEELERTLTLLTNILDTLKTETHLTYLMRRHGELSIDQAVALILEEKNRYIKVMEGRQ